MTKRVMPRWMRCLALNVALILLPSPVSADTYSPHVGEKHMNFTLPAIDDGRAISLAQFRGRKVLLIQFAAW